MSTGYILLAALNRAGFDAALTYYDNLVDASIDTDCVVFYLNLGDAEKARACLENPSLKFCRRILVIDPRDADSRELVAGVRVDEVIFRPVRIQNFVARIQLLFERSILPDSRELTLCDELAFAQTMQELIDAKFSGIFTLHAHSLDAQIYFVRGNIRGVRAGNKTKELAVLSLWRIFPASYHLEKSAPAPEWAEKNINYSFAQIVNLAVKTGTFFNESFGDIRMLQSCFKMNGVQLESALPGLPEKVQKILSCFDGSRTLEEILNGLIIDEYLLMQIIRRLIDENLLTECRHDLDDNITMDAWIHGARGSQAEMPQDDEDRSVESTPSVMFFACQGSENEHDEEPSADVSIPGIIPGMPIPDEVGDLLQLEDPIEYETFSRDVIEKHLEECGFPMELSCVEIRPNEIYSDIFLQHEAIRDEENALALQAEDEDFLNLSIDFSDDDQELRDFSSGGIEAQHETIERTAADDSQENELRWDENAQNLDAEDNPSYSADVYYPYNQTEFEPWNPENESENGSDDEEFPDDESGDYSPSGRHKLIELTPSEQQRAVQLSPSGNHRSVDITRSGMHQIVELSPEEWKRRTLRRIQRESKARDDRTMRYLLGGLILVLLVLAIVLYVRFHQSNAEAHIEQGAMERMDRAD